jgi:hypothetical protein
MTRLLVLLFAVALAAGAASPAAAQGNIAIVEPEAESTVHSNEGKVTVRVGVPRGIAPGNQVVILLDGRAVARGAATSFELDGVERGTHTLQAQVVDGSGNTLVASPPVTFHMWQASRQFPSRKDG